MGVRTPRLIMLDRDGRYLSTDTALVEDVGSVRLETLLEHDPAAAAAPTAALGAALRRMHTTVGSRYGRPVDLARGTAPRAQPVEDFVVERAYGELGPDHVLVTPAGEAVLIDIEGLSYFDVEWEHAFLQLRFGAAYPRLGPVDLDPARLELYRYAQVLSLIEGPLRIADTDFPDRDWMRRLAERNIAKALDQAAG